MQWNNPNFRKKLTTVAGDGLSTEVWATYSKAKGRCEFSVSKKKIISILMIDRVANIVWVSDEHNLNGTMYHTTWLMEIKTCYRLLWAEYGMRSWCYTFDCTPVLRPENRAWSSRQSEERARVVDASDRIKASADRNLGGSAPRFTQIFDSGVRRRSRFHNHHIRTYRHESASP